MDPCADFLDFSRIMMLKEQAVEGLALSRKVVVMHTSFRRYATSSARCVLRVPSAAVAACAAHSIHRVQGRSTIRPPTATMRRTSDGSPSKALRES